MNAIREFRDKAGLSQERLGASCGLTKAAISNYETGARTPDLATGRRIVRVLNEAGVSCTLDDVFPPSGVAA